MSRRTVLVTGGAGFLGEHLARRILADGDQVRILDNAPPPDWAAVPGLEYVRGDVRDLATVTQAAHGVSAIVHAAFASPRQTPGVIRSANVGGTQNICAAAESQGGARLVLVSSTVVAWQPRAHPFWPGSPLGRLDLYRSTRTEAEALVTAATTRTLKTAIVRPQSFLGPGRLGAFGIIFPLILAGEPVPVLGTSAHRYQLLGVRDLADGISLLTRRDSEGVFSFGAREFGTVREDFDALFARIGSRTTLRHVPPRIARVALRAIELGGMVPLSEWHRHSAWGRDSIADTTRAEQELGWAPSQSNTDALVEAYNWFVATLRETGDAPRTHPLPRTHRILKRLLWMLPRS